jgi:hypothetical protein
MPVSYSNLPIVRGTARADSVANLIADLDTLVTAAGWTTRSTVTGGFMYTLTSPQGFACKVRIIDAADYEIPGDMYTGPSVVVQFMDSSEARKSFPHQLMAHNFGNWPEFQVICGICQLFISVPGHTPGEIGYGWSSVAGGIPSRPNDTGPCNAGLGAVTVTEIWWSCGGSQFAYDFRTSANCYGDSTYSFNGTTVTVPDDNRVAPYDGDLCLFPLTPVDTYTIPVQYPAITYSSHNPLCIDAFIGWGYRIRGQLWDAFLQTNAQGIDTLGSFSDTDTDGKPVRINAQCWYSDFYSSLRLIYGSPTDAGSGGNVAY